MSVQQEEFTQSVALLIQKAAALGYGVTFGEAWRTPEQARINATNGSGISRSLHIERLAIDLNLFKDGRYITNDEGHKLLGPWWKALHSKHRWGGDFTKRDFNHYSSSPDGERG